MNWTIYQRSETVRDLGKLGEQTDKVTYIMTGEAFPFNDRWYLQVIEISIAFGVITLTMGEELDYYDLLNVGNGSINYAPVLIAGNLTEATRFFASMGYKVDGSKMIDLEAAKEFQELLIKNKSTLVYNK